MNRIIYVQSNEEKARELVYKFHEDEIQVQVAKTGNEAFEIAKKQMPQLILVDINIPDMGLDELISWFGKKKPKIHVKVLVDVIDPVMIAKLSNKYHVDSIYAEPIDVDQIALDIEEFIKDLNKSGDESELENSLASEIDELEKAVKSLKSKLRKQQKSYGKLSALTKCFTDALANKGDGTEIYKDKLAFVEGIFSNLLKVQTTGSFDVEKFDEDIRRELQDITKKAYGFEVGEIRSCLFGGQSRSKAQNIRFIIYLLSRLYAECSNSFRVDVDSHYITIRDTEFIVTFTFSGKEKDKIKETHSDYVEFAYAILENMTGGYRIKNEEHTITYYLQFSV